MANLLEQSHTIDSIVRVGTYNMCSWYSTHTSATAEHLATYTVLNDYMYINASNKVIVWPVIQAIP